MDKTDALELAWGVIANAGNGDWTKETPEWQEAAARWRDSVMPDLSAELATRTPEPPDSGDGAALTGIDAALAEVEAIDPADFESKASVLVEVRAILRARLRSGSPAPEGGA